MYRVMAKPILALILTTGGTGCGTLDLPFTDAPILWKESLLIGTAELISESDGSALLVNSLPSIALAGSGIVACAPLIDQHILFAPTVQDPMATRVILSDLPAGLSSVYGDRAELSR